MLSLCCVVCDFFSHLSFVVDFVWYDSWSFRLSISSSIIPISHWIWQKKPVRRRYEPYGMYSDDDANSDASSVCSERSYGSRNGGIPHYLRQTEDVAEVLNHCASSNWSERKEGLLGLQNLLKSQRTLR